MDATISSFGRLRVGVLGDGIVDHYVHGRPTRLSREAPVMVLRHESEELRPGGAANVARNLAALGAKVSLFGALGDDDAGIELRAAVAACGVDVSGLAVAPDWTTPTKTRVLAGEGHRAPQQVLRLDREPSQAPSEVCLEGVARALESRASELDALIVSDYGYGTLGADALRTAGALARRGLPVVVDPRERPDLVPGPLALTPNIEELARFDGCEPARLEHPAALVRAARGLAQRVGARWVLATLGNRGMALVGSHGEQSTVPVSGSLEVVDVSGAGDTVASVFALALAAGRDALDAMVMANAAAGLVVLERGTAAPEPRALDAALGSAPRPRQLQLDQEPRAPQTLQAARSGAASATLGPSSSNP